MIKSMSARLVLVSLLVGPSVSAVCQTTQIRQHRLTVATALPVTDQQLDEIIRDLNLVLHNSHYSWDVRCPDVEFVKTGNIIKNGNLLTTGTYGQLAQSLHDNAPSANVMIVVGIDCNAQVHNAAGCSPIGGEPLVVGSYPGFNDQLWAHERGHGVGLQHSAEYPTQDTSAPQNVGMRFMFWQLGVGHLGKTAEECTAFMTANLPSIVTVAGAAAPNTHDASASQGPGASAMPTGLPDAVAQETSRAAAAVGLTVPAFRVIGPPWVEKTPLNQIEGLNNADVASIRRMVESGVNAFTAQGITVLGILGTADDVRTVTTVLQTPLPAAGPGTTIDGQALINLLRAKLAVPEALGLLANRTGSAAAVETLGAIRSLQNSVPLVGPPQAYALSLYSIRALAVAGTPAARSLVDQTLQEASAPAAIPRDRVATLSLNAVQPPGIPALSPEEISNIHGLQSRTQSMGPVRALFE